MATKTTISEQLAAKRGISKKEAADLVGDVFGLLFDTLKAGEEIQVAGFGTFTNKIAEPKEVRNPRSGEMITTQRSRKVGFKSSKVLKEAV